MSAISQKSISGITSITSPAGTDDQISLHTSNTNEALKIDGAGNIHIHNHVNTTGVSSASNFKTGSSNLHSSGLSAASIDVGSNIKLGNAGVITATSFVGSGANLTNLNASAIASGTVPTARLGSGTANSSTFLRGDSTFAAVTSTTINNNADNRIITGSGTANTLEAESGFTFNGSGVQIGTGNPFIHLKDTTNNTDAYIQSDDNGSIFLKADDNAESGSSKIVLQIDGTERVRIDSNGQLLVGTTTSGTNVRAVFQGYNGGGENFQARVQFQTAQATNLSTNHHLANLLFTNASSSVGAEIRVQADENWGTSDYPTRISFLTTPNGSATRSERLIIKNDGVVNIGVASPQYAKKLNVQGGNDSTISVSNQDYTGYAAGSQSGIEGRLQCGNSIWTSAGIRFKKFNGTIGDKHSYLELYATDGYSNKVGLVVQPDGQVSKPLQPAFRATESSHNQTGLITFDQIVTNVGNHYSGSNGRFTAPVAGTYFFSFYGMAGQASGNLRVEYYINGSAHSSGEHYGGVAYAHGGSYSHISCSTILTLNANDYVNLHWNPSYNKLHSYHNGFMGYLIG